MLVLQEQGEFSAWNREQLCKTSSVKGKRLTLLYRQWGQLCSWIGSYCCSKMLLSPVHVWWMNHLAIGQAGSYCLCNKHKRFPPQRALHYRSNEKSSRWFAIHQFTWAGNNLQKPFTATYIITSWDLPWNNLEKPGCSICCLCIHWSEKCTLNATAYISLCEKGEHMGSPYIFAITPTPLFPIKKMKTKLWGIVKGVHSAS